MKGRDKIYEGGKHRGQEGQRSRKRRRDKEILNHKPSRREKFYLEYKRLLEGNFLRKVPGTILEDKTGELWVIEIKEGGIYSLVRKLNSRSLYMFLNWKSEEDYGFKPYYSAEEFEKFLIKREIYKEHQKF